MSAGTVVCFGLAAALALWVLLVWRGLSQNWLPAEFRTAKLVAIEEDIVVATRDFVLIGRPDRVYRLASGEHVPLELKNRDRAVVYATDIAEISLRAWLLRRTGRATAPHGYIAVNVRGQRRRVALQVQLKDDAYCEALITRYAAIKRGAVAPRKSRGGKCKTCGHAARCG